MTTATRRPISIEGLTPPKEPISPGPAPMLDWIAIDKLVVDDTYQRPISKGGVTNIRKIASAFDWSKFAPVIVAPVEGGLFAIVDGQHRTTAAALVGVRVVPCQIVQANAGEQAAAFKAINANVTKVSTMVLFHASVAAGDPEAVALVELCRNAGVTLLRYPKAVYEIKPGETMAVACIASRVRLFGPETVSLALRCVTQTRHNKAGALNMTMIQGLCNAIGGNRAWRSDEARLLRTVERIALQRELEKVASWPRTPGVPIEIKFTMHLEALLREEWPK